MPEPFAPVQQPGLLNFRKSMSGPKGKGAINQDTYDGVAPMSLLPAPPKQINAGDSKLGPPKPAATRGAGINLDSFHE